MAATAVALPAKQQPILCGPPCEPSPLFDAVFIKVLKKRGRGYSPEEFAASKESEHEYGGKVLANFDVIIRWNHVNYRVSVDPQERLWHARLRSRLASIVTKRQQLSTPIDPRRIRLEDNSKPVGLTRIDESNESLAPLRKLSMFGLRLIVLEPPGEGRLEPLAEPPTYSFPEPENVVPGTILNANKLNVLETNARNNAKLLSDTIMSTMVPIATKLAMLRGSEAPDGLHAMHERVMDELSTPVPGAACATMSSKGSLAAALRSANCPDVASSATGLALLSARKICKLAATSHGLSPSQVEKEARDVCLPIANLYAGEALNWSTRAAARVECPSPAPRTAQMGSELPTALHTVAAPLGRAIVEHIEQRLIAETRADPYRQSVSLGTSPMEAFVGSKTSIFDNQAMFTNLARKSSERRSPYIPKSESSANRVGTRCCFGLKASSAPVSGSIGQVASTKAALSLKDYRGPIRTVTLSAMPILRVDPIAARRGSTTPATVAPLPPYPQVIPEEDVEKFRALREIKCPHCAGATQLIAVSDSFASQVKAAGDRLPADLPIIECKFCKMGVPHNKPSKADPPGQQQEEDDDATQVTIDDAASQGDASNAPGPVAPAPPTALAPGEPSAETASPAEERPLIAFEEQSAPERTPAEPASVVQQQPQQPPPAPQGGSDPVPLPEVSRRTPLLQAGVEQPLPPYPPRGTALLRVVNASSGGILVNIGGAVSMAVPARSYADSPPFPAGVHAVVIQSDVLPRMEVSNKWRFTQRNLHALDFSESGKITMRIAHVYAINKIAAVERAFNRHFRGQGAPGQPRVSADTGIYILPSSTHVSADPSALAHLHIRATAEQAKELFSRTYEDDGVFSGQKGTFAAFEVPAHLTNVNAPLRICRDELSREIAARRPDGTDYWAKVEGVIAVDRQVADSGHGSLVLAVDAPIADILAAART